MRKSYIVNLFLLLFISAGFFSCSSTKKIKYFQDIPDSGQLKTIQRADYIEPKVQVGDVLSVNVQTLDPTATQVINSGNNSASTAAGLAQAATISNSSLATPSGYLVNKDGDIDLPVLGKINVSTHTISEVTGLVKEAAAKFYKDPAVIVRFANFRISVTGEVLKPGVYTMPSEKVSILEGLAMAGDLTVFGKRENVLLIRENPDGTRTPYRVNLKKSDIMTAPYYYLRQNDVIYVEPRKAKSDATDAAQQKYITIAGALLSIILVLAYRVK